MEFKIHSPVDFNYLQSTFIVSEDRTFTPLLKIFQDVSSRGCKSVVEELDYIDNDFLSEYESFYARNFRKVEKYCKRLHFFSTELTDSELDSLNQDKFKNTYLGFVVIRPLNVCRVGRTILTPPVSHDDFFILCKAKFESHIMGTKFEIETMPFMQQDTSVGACAQACLWMVTRYMHKKHFLPLFLPYQITDFATRSISMGSVMPNRKGLHDFQMLEALRLVGLQCGFERFAPDWSDIPASQLRAHSVSRFIYPYLESELPVVLNLQFPNRPIGHALVAIGHTFDRNPAPQKFNVKLGDGTNVDVLSNVSWIPKFIVHNDAMGPYQEIEIYSPDPDALSLDKVTSVIGVLPKEVSIFPEEVETNVIGTVQILIREADELKGINIGEIAFRTYLRESNLYKADLLSGKCECSDELKGYYKRLAMPKYVWVTEISTQQHINNKLSRERKVIGEFLTDSTANPIEGMGIFLSLRLNKILAIQNLRQGNWDFITLSMADSYPGLARLKA